MTSQVQGAETTPLVRYAEGGLQDQESADKLADCFSDYCDRKPLENPYQATKRVLRGCATVVSASAKIPYAPISLQLGPVLGPIAVVGNSTAFFALEYWTANAMINSMLGEKTIAEERLFQGEPGNEKSLCQKIIIITPAAVLALASQLPTVLAGVHYNDEKYKVAAGFVLVIAGSLLPMRSIQLSIEEIRTRMKNTTESEIAMVQQRMSAHIRKYHNAFIEMKREDKNAFILTCNGVRNLDPSTEKTSRYVLTFLRHENAPRREENGVVETAIDYFGFGVGALSAGIFEYALGQYTFDMSKQEFWNNDIAGGVFATFAVGSTAYLYGRSIVRTTQRIFNAVGNFFTGNEVLNLGWQLRPKLSFALSSIGLLTDLCALGPTYVIWGGFYNQNEIEHELFQKTMCASLFMLLFTATLDIVNDIVSYSIEKGSDEEREILTVHREFQKLTELVEKSPSREFIRFLTNMDGETQREMLEKLSLSRDQLAVYASDLIPKK